MNKAPERLKDMGIREIGLVLVLGVWLWTPGCTSLPRADELPEVPELNDPFLFLDGSRVRDRRDWERRRAEIRAILEHYQFGHAPPSPGKDGIQAEPLSESEVLQGAGRKRSVRLRFGPALRLSLTTELFIPARAKGPFATIVYNSADPMPVPDQTLEDLLRRGYVLASYRRKELHPDWQYQPEARDKDYGPVKAAYPDYDWGAVMVWAWGGRVVLDYLSGLPEIDPARIAATGHSRGGQVAAILGLIDERVTLVAPSAGGTITTGCHRFGKRRWIRERMDPKNAAEYYHPNLAEFAGRETRLPFDLHLLKAAIAPRAWFNSNGLSDHYNVEGGMITWRAARVVYEWMGVKDRCAQWYRPGGHDQGVDDWKALADFADYVFFGKPLPQPESFYREPWPQEPRHFSWTAPAAPRF